MHFAATLLALIGVTVSAFWIMSANSWMQTPAGVSFNNNTFKVISWFDVVFNPLFIPRFLHMLIGTYISTLLVILAICAHYLLQARFMKFSKTCFAVALSILIVLVPLQLLLGDDVGLRVVKYQPIKTAAIEGAWDTQKGAPLILFAIPNQTRATNDYAISIPKLASYINTHQLDGQLLGLKSVPAAERPYVPLVFFSFRVMVGLWVIMMLLAATGAILHFKKRLYKTRWYLYSCMFTAPIGFISIITGWFTAEFGRQPWVIYHILKTSAAASPTVQPHQVVISLVSIIGVYGIIFGYFYFRYFFKIISAGPDTPSAKLDDTFIYLPSPVSKPDNIQ